MKKNDRLRLTLSAVIAVALTAAVGCEPNKPKVRPSLVHAAAGTTADMGRAHDAGLAARLRAALESDPATGDADIQVFVMQGHVQLSGFVDSAATKLRAGVLAAEIEGVQGVENRLIRRHHAGIAPDPLGGARVHL